MYIINIIVLHNLARANSSSGTCLRKAKRFVIQKLRSATAQFFGPFSSTSAFSPTNNFYQGKWQALFQIFLKFLILFKTFLVLNL